MVKIEEIEFELNHPVSLHNGLGSTYIFLGLREKDHQPVFKVMFPPFVQKNISKKSIIVASSPFSIEPI